MTKIKICGLRRPEDIEAANACKPDYIGFIFAEFRRKVTPEQARELRAMLDPSIQAIGVFVDAPQEQVTELLRSGIIDAAQLHGSETPEMAGEIRRQTGKPVIKALKMTGSARLEVLASWNESDVDYLLLDAGTGQGKTFDWSLADMIRRECRKPFFLAGGLNVDNVARGIECFAPYAVDVSSAVETEGWKDPAKMKEFVHAARMADK